jgi:hypothetical protein
MHSLTESCYACGEQVVFTGDVCPNCRQRRASVASDRTFSGGADRMLEFDCPRCHCQLRYTADTIGMVKCLACEELFVVPKDAPVVVNHRRISLPSYSGTPEVPSHSEIHNRSPRNVADKWRRRGWWMMTAGLLIAFIDLSNNPGGSFPLAPIAGVLCTVGLILHFSNQ